MKLKNNIIGERKSEGKLIMEGGVNNLCQLISGHSIVRFFATNICLSFICAIIKP